MQKLSADQCIYYFDSQMEKKYEVGLDEEFLVQTNDCFCGQIKNENQGIHDLDYDKLNPATGPIFIKGVKAGDTIKIHIKDIQIADKGHALCAPGGGVLGKEISKSLTKQIPIVDGKAIFHEGISLEICPMIGVIGVATAEEDGKISTDTPWKHGGNMDTTKIRAGASLYLKANCDGALLALGDIHALMGDGEVCFTGLEISGEVLLEVERIAGKSFSWPILENEDHFSILVSRKTLEEAVHEATLTACQYLSKGLDLSLEEAYILASLSVDLEISQVVDPNVTVRACIPKTLMTMETLIEKYEA